MLLFVASPAPLESAGTPLDGLRAQAGQTRGLECILARRPAGCLLADGWRYGEAGPREVRDHAGHRYAVAARCGAATGGGDGASVESRAVLRGGGAGLRRIRHPAAESWGQPARRRAIAIRTPFWQRAGHRSLYARRVGRIPGPRSEEH